MTQPTLDNSIGIMQERSLHAALKRWYARPGDRLEEKVDGFLIDICRAGLLVEIQTRNFSAVKHKLTRLSNEHPVLLVYPIAREKWIVRLAADGLTQLSRRKSPKRGSRFQLFEELVSLPELMTRRNFSLEVLLIREEEVRREVGKGGRRRGGWTLFDRRLIDVVERLFLTSPGDFRTFLPTSLPEPFTTSDLANALGKPRYLAQQMCYCLRKMGTINVVGKRRNALLYAH